MTYLTFGLKKSEIGEKPDDRESDADAPQRLFGEPFAELSGPRLDEEQSCRNEREPDAEEVHRMLPVIVGEYVRSEEPEAPRMKEEVEGVQ